MYPIVHRGEHRRHDENTIGAITAVRRAEVDLRLTRDHRFILMHDAKLNRTTNGTGYVHRRSWRYISSLRTEPHGDRVPTWAQVVSAAAASGTRLVVEIKQYNAYWSPRRLRQVARQVRSEQMVGRVHFGGYGVVGAMADAAPRMRTYWRPDRNDDVTAEEVQHRSADAALVLPDRLSRAIVRRVNEGGFPVWARRGKRPAGLTQEEYWTRIARTGVQGLYTDRPQAFRAWCRG